MMFLFWLPPLFVPVLAPSRVPVAIGVRYEVQAGVDRPQKAMACPTSHGVTDVEIRFY
jgi:hypothetical protein